MSKILTEVLSANKSYAATFGDKANLALPPARSFAILTCMDARLDPAKYAGLAEGDAHVIRNAGGRASDDAIRSLVISYKLLGTKEFFVIHHTDCGMEFFTNDVIRGLLANSLETASLTSEGFKDVGKGPGSTAGRVHRVPHHQRSGRVRPRRRHPNPQQPTRAEIHSHLRLHLRRKIRQTHRGASCHHRRTGQFIAIKSARTPHPQREDTEYCTSTPFTKSA